MSETLETQLAAERELSAALMEQMSYLRAGCLNASRDELIGRITAVSAPEWRRGHWLGSVKRAAVAATTAELRATIAELTAQVQALTDVAGEDNNDWTGS